jgi:hypothetical protein
MIEHFYDYWIERYLLLQGDSWWVDMQMVSLTLRVMSRPDFNHLPKIYQNLGLEWVSSVLPFSLLLLTRPITQSMKIWAGADCSYDERVLPSIGNEVLKATVAQFDGERSYSERIHRSDADSQLLSLLRIEKSFLLGLGMISWIEQRNSISCWRMFLLWVSPATIS